MPATPIKVVAAGPPNYGGLWWINLTHQGDIIFATWFTYGHGVEGSESITRQILQAPGTLCP